MAVLLGLGACAVPGGGDDRTYADEFQAFEQLDDPSPLFVPVEPPPGYALFTVVSARTWVPTGFLTGTVPTVTLCPVPAGVDPAGACFGTEQTAQVSVIEVDVEGQRLVVVAQDGEGFAAEDMIDDWRPVAYTSDWRSLSWITQPVTPAADAA